MKKSVKLFKEAMQFISKKKYGKAYPLLLAAHKLGHAESTYAIATWHLFGRVVKKNYKKAFLLLRLSAKKKYPAACFDLAISYEKGKGTKKNLKKAFYWFKVAANLGDTRAHFKTGLNAKHIKSLTKIVDNFVYEIKQRTMENFRALFPKTETTNIQRWTPWLSN